MARSNADTPRVLHTYLSSLRTGEPQLMEALAVVPLHTDSLTPSLSYLTLAGAHAHHQVVVSEKAHARVPTLLVINKAPSHILILDGPSTSTVVSTGSTPDR